MRMNSQTGTTLVHDFPQREFFSSYWNDAGFLQEQLLKLMIRQSTGHPSAGSRGSGEAVRRGLSPFPLIQFCSISNTCVGMMLEQLVWRRLVTAGSPANSSEVNCVSLHIFTDVSE